jgi:4-amino-4-deoxy-L-arabinose transferase-like glycosyltransferase
VKFLRARYLLLVGILILGLILRGHNLTTVPRLGATFDEFAWTWLGMNLVEKHTPISWSPHQAYEGHRTHKTYLGAQFWIVNPYLEHPPVFGMIAGSFALLNGAHQMYDVTLHNIRPLGLILGVFSILMVFFFVKEFYDEKLALVAAFLYAIIPTIVIGSRLVQNENFFIPFFLLTLILAGKFIKTNKYIFLILAGLLSGILMLAKVPWVAVPLAVSMIFFYNRKYKDTFKFLAIVVPIFLVYFLYGIHYDSHIFFSLWKLQLARYDIAFDSFLAIFTTPLLADRFYLDGWIYFGWFAFLLLLVKDIRKNYFLVFGVLAYLAVFIFAVPNEPGHGWYRFPFYPFLIISTAIFLKDHFNKNLILTLLFLLVVGLSMLQNSWAINFGFSFIVFRGTLLLFGLGMLPLFFQSKRIKQIGKYSNYASLILIVFLTIWSVYSFIDL